MKNLLTHFRSIEGKYVELDEKFYRIGSVFPSIIAYGDSKNKGGSVQIQLDPAELKKYNLLTFDDYITRLKELDRIKSLKEQGIIKTEKKGLDQDAQTKPKCTEEIAKGKRILESLDSKGNPLNETFEERIKKRDKSVAYSPTNDF